MPAHAAKKGDFAKRTHGALAGRVEGIEQPKPCFVAWPECPAVTPQPREGSINDRTMVTSGSADHDRLSVRYAGNQY